VNGVLIIDKPVGLTSHDVVARVRKMIGERSVGHTGTLDPFASGVLVMLVGRATRLAQFLSGAEKEYEAVIRLGSATNTGDLTGAALEPARTQAPEFSVESIERAMAALRGEIEQTPPMYSAKKVNGRKLYEFARRGEQVERHPVRVVISEFETMPGVSAEASAPGTLDLAVRVVCSAGTYIRTLAEQFGNQLGVGAHLASLRRTRAGTFRIEDARTLDEIKELADAKLIEPELICPDSALSHLPLIALDEAQARRTLNGIDLEIENDGWGDRQFVRMRDPSGNLLAVGSFNASRNVLHPAVVIGERDLPKE
jgi:tRNA pseudouridine55 synthase